MTQIPMLFPAQPAPPTVPLPLVAEVSDGIFGAVSFESLMTLPVKAAALPAAEGQTDGTPAQGDATLAMILPAPMLAFPETSKVPVLATEKVHLPCDGVAVKDPAALPGEPEAGPLDLPTWPVMPTIAVAPPPNAIPSSSPDASPTEVPPSAAAPVAAQPVPPALPSDQARVGQGEAARRGDARPPVSAATDGLPVAPRPVPVGAEVDATRLSPVDALDKNVTILAESAPDLLSDLSVIPPGAATQSGPTIASETPETAGAPALEPPPKTPSVLPAVLASSAEAPRASDTPSPATSPRLPEPTAVIAPTALAIHRSEAPPASPRAELSSPAERLIRSVWTVQADVQGGAPQGAAETDDPTTQLVDKGPVRSSEPPSRKHKAEQDGRADPNSQAPVASEGKIKPDTAVAPVLPAEGPRPEHPQHGLPGSLHGAPPGPTAPPTPLRGDHAPTHAPPPATQIAQAVSQSGETVTELRLSPDELGHVRIDMRSEGDRMIMTVSAERQDTLDLLRRNADRLLSEMRSSGFAELDLGFSQWSSGGSDRPPSMPAIEPLPGDDWLSPPDLPIRPQRASTTSGLDIRL